MDLTIKVDLKKRIVVVDAASRTVLNLPPPKKRDMLQMYGPWPRDAYDNPVWASHFLQSISDTFSFARDFEETDDNSVFWGTSGL